MHPTTDKNSLLRVREGDDHVLVDDRDPVGLVEERQTTAPCPLQQRPINQVVEGRIRPSAVVQWAARVKPAVKVILRIRIAGHPMVKGDMGPVVELDIPCYHVLLEADGQAEHLTPAVDQGVNVGRPPPDRHGDPELPAMCRAAEGFPGEVSIEA
ncbi:MAG: hypothetical protein E6I22_11155, partial [Chloroflexi bacterium]